MKSFSVLDQVEEKKETNFPFYYKCFLLVLFIAIQVRTVHQRPLCIRSLTSKATDTDTDNRLYTHIFGTIPGRRFI